MQSSNKGHTMDYLLRKCSVKHILKNRKDTAMNLKYQTWRSDVLTDLVFYLFLFYINEKVVDHLAKIFC